MEINFSENKDAWNEFVDGSPHRSIFVKTCFLDALNVKYDLVTCSDGREILAGVVILFDKDGNPMQSVHKFTQYQGLLLADNSKILPHSRIPHEFKVVEFLIAGLVSKYKKFYLCQHWRFNDMRPFQWYNYHEPEKGTFKIQLRYAPIIGKESYCGFEKFLKSVRRNRKREYQRAKKDLTFDNIKDEKVLDRLHGEVFKRQGIERSEKDSMLVRSITRKALDGGFGSLKCATKNDVPLAVLLSLGDGRTSFFLFGAAEPGERDQGGYTYLSVQAIKDAFENGCAEVDIVGANSPNRSDYKISFNAELKPYFEVFYGK